MAGEDWSWTYVAGVVATAAAVVTVGVTQADLAALLPEALHHGSGQVVQALCAGAISAGLDVFADEPHVPSALLDLRPIAAPYYPSDCIPHRFDPTALITTLCAASALPLVICTPRRYSASSLK